MPPVFLDRSRIVARQECPTLRYFHYHKTFPDNPEIVGIQRPIPPMHLGIGLAVHKGLEILLLTGDIAKAMGQEVEEIINKHSQPNTHSRRELTYLVKGLIYGWYRERYPAIIRDYEVIDAEKVCQWLVALYRSAVFLLDL